MTVNREELKVEWQATKVLNGEIASIDESGIKVTAKMIEAGLGAWSQWDERFELSEEMIVRVYLDMAGQRLPE